jgi:hypothetical protein
LALLREENSEIDDDEPPPVFEYIAVATNFAEAA